MCTEVQVGKAHAVTSGDAQFASSQSGLWDMNILCASHDGELGRFEAEALTAFQRLRAQAAGQGVGTYDLTGIDSRSLLKFYAAILFKYAITRKELGKIELGPFLEPIQNFLFRNAPVPTFLDALLIRPLLHAADAEVFAYRAPRWDRKFNRNMYRMMMGGVIAFVLVDNTPLQDPHTRVHLIKDSAVPKYTVLPAQQFEEFTMARALIADNDRLASYLEKQEHLAMRP